MSWSIWWVNRHRTFRQGLTDQEERARGALWAPLWDKRGRTRRHWETLAEVRAGDLIVHYSRGRTFRRGAVRAIGRALADGRAAPKPAGTRDPSGTDRGHAVRVECRALSRPGPDLPAIPVAAVASA